MSKKAKVKNKVGRPKWIPPDLDYVEKLASRGLTQQQISDSLGISETTFYERKAELAEFAEAIKRGKAKGIVVAVNALFKNVTSGNLGAQVFYLKNNAGWKDKTETELTGKDGKPIETNTNIKVEAIDSRIAELFRGT